MSKAAAVGLVLVGAGIVTAVATAAAFAQAQKKPPPPPPATLGSLTLSVSPANANPGSTVTFTLMADDTSGMPLSGVQAGLFEGGMQVATFPATNSQGVSSVSITAPSAGTYAYTAQSGTITSNTSTLVVAITVSLASLQLVASATSIQAGQSITFTVTAIGSGGLPLDGISPQLTANGTVIGTFPATTGEGRSSLTVTFNQTGSFTMQAQDGSVTSNTITVTVSGSSTTYTITITVSPTTLPATGGSVTVNGTSNLPPNTSGIVRVEDGSGFTAFNVGFTTDSSGNFSVTASIPPNNSGSPRSIQFIASATVGGVTYKSPAVYVQQSA